MAAPANERDLAQDAARGRRRAVAAQLELAATLDAGRGARLAIDDRGRRDVDRLVGRRARQLAREPLGAPHLLPQRALLLALLAPGTRRTRHDLVSHVGVRG